MEPKNAEQMLDILTKFADENFDKKKFGFLFVVAEQLEGEDIKFHQRTSMQPLMTDYHLASLQELGMITVKKLIAEGIEKPKSSTKKPEPIQ